jgi:hypothetical protein
MKIGKISSFSIFFFYFVEYKTGKINIVTCRFTYQIKK